MKTTNFLRNTSGQDLIEYTLLMAFVALASFALFLGAGGSIKGIWESPVNVHIAIIGDGRVIANNQNDACNANCTINLKEGNNVALTARANEGWQFQGWTDACETTDSQCRLANVKVSQRLTATFTRIEGK